MSAHRRSRGTVLAMALMALLVVTLLGGLVLQRFILAHRQSRSDLDRLQAEWLAEAAVGRAIARRSADPEYRGETWQVSESALAAAGVAEIRVEPEPAADALFIAVDVRFPAEGPRQMAVKREYQITSPNRDDKID